MIVERRRRNPDLIEDIMEDYGFKNADDIPDEEDPRMAEWVDGDWLEDE